MGVRHQGARIRKFLLPQLSEDVDELRVEVFSPWQTAKPEVDEIQWLADNIALNDVCISCGVLLVGGPTAAEGVDMGYGYRRIGFEVASRLVRTSSIGQMA